jgi:glyoxylate/hydroxypyruvate reductase
MTAPSGHAILLATGSMDPGPWARAVGTGDPARRLFVWPDLPDPSEIGYLLTWNPQRKILSALPNLKAILSLGAGVDHLIGSDDLPDVPIIRVVNPDLTQRMSEWIVLQVLVHHRQHLAYDRQQLAREWREREQPAAAEIRIGIMGLGVLGRDAAEILLRLGFQVSGWSRGAKSIPDIACFHGADGLTRFLAQTDILVTLLPLTPETRGILSKSLFAELARDGALGGPILINAGRGGLQIEADIVDAIERGVLIGASLDVFESEPLDAKSPLWALPNVVITPHAAAASMPNAIVPPLLRQIAAFEAGAPFENLVNRDHFY